MPGYIKIQLNECHLKVLHMLNISPKKYTNIFPVVKITVSYVIQYLLHVHKSNQIGCHEGNKQKRCEKIKF